MESTEIVIPPALVFMQTVACQVVSGIFTWAAILISCHHVSCVFFLFLV